MKVCLGGTFDNFHRGHQDLLDMACDHAEELVIGLTSDVFANERRQRVVSPYHKRRLDIQDYLRGYHPHVGFEIVALEEDFGPALEGAFDAIVVSEGTRATAQELNGLRSERGLPALQVIMVPHRLAQDGLPISSTRIAMGEIDVKGRLLRPLRVAIGSANPVKVEAVKACIDRFFDEVTYHHRGADSQVAEQPVGVDETAKGALNRARAVLQGEVDLGIGIEAGLIASPLEEEWLDVQYCVIVDRSGRVTLGHGAGFSYPPAVLRAVEQGETVGQIMARLSGIPDIGARKGAIGYLSLEALDRQGLTEQAVLAAIIPRLRQSLYHVVRPLEPEVEDKRSAKLSEGKLLRRRK